MIRYYYISRYRAMSHECLVYEVSIEPREDAHPLEDAVLFVGDNLPYYVTYIEEDNTVREATRFELVRDGIVTLDKNEFIHGTDVLHMRDYSKPIDMVKPVFNKEDLVWVETATQEELDKNQFEQSVKFYNDELIFATKATAELACEIITQEAYNDVKVYMQAIDPYVKPMSVAILSEIKRPSIFDRYN